MPTITIASHSRSHLESSILDNGLLDAVKKWLEPLPDKSLPALNIQRSLMQLLTKVSHFLLILILRISRQHPCFTLQMSIDTQSLKSSELGKIVLFYTKCKRVDPTIKRLADNLVSKSILAPRLFLALSSSNIAGIHASCFMVATWLRPIIQRPVSYRSRAPLPQSSGHGDPEIINPGSQPAAPIASGSGNQTNRTQRARIPDTIHQAFHIAPTHDLPEEGGSQSPAFRKGSQKATAKKTREWARKMTDAKKGQRLG